MAPAPGIGIRSKISRVSGWKMRVGSNLCALIDENPSDGLGDPHASDYDIGVPQFLIRVHLFLIETAGQASLSDTKPCLPCMLRAPPGPGEMLKLESLQREGPQSLASGASLRADRWT